MNFVTLYPLLQLLQGPDPLPAAPYNSLITLANSAASLLSGAQLATANAMIASVQNDYSARLATVINASNG